MTSVTTPSSLLLWSPRSAALSAFCTSDRCFQIHPKAAGDRAAFRAMHFFDENRRVQMRVRALKNDIFAAFLNYVNESGNASWELLQNITPFGATTHQEMALTLALCRKLLGGGFAGTVFAFVPNEKFNSFKIAIEAALGSSCCHKLAITE